MRFSFLFSITQALKFGFLNEIHLNLNLDLAHERQLSRQNVPDMDQS